MDLSQSSNPPDPLSDVLEVLGARVTRRTRFEAAGRWALSFPGVDRLKFVAVLRGRSWMLLPGQAPQEMAAGDVCLIGRTGYGIASDPAVRPMDGAELYQATDTVRLGGDETLGIGGTVTFAGETADFLMDMLPDFLLVPRGTAGSGAVGAVLGLISDEVGREGDGRAAMGRGIVSARLADVLVVEAIRAHAAAVGAEGTGWLGALADPRLGRALQALHGDVAHPWTVAGLAQVAGMSRAGFSAAFSYRVGQAPLAYLRHWRLTLARTALARGEESVAGVAARVGYGSQSAFGQAYRRAFGVSPKVEARRVPPLRQPSRPGRGAGGPKG